MKNRIIFWSDAFLLHFCLAYYLQSKYDADYYAIFDVTDKPKNFFLNQKLVDFKKTWFYHDSIKIKSKPDLSYLSNFEQKYNIDLWKIAINERLFYRFNNFYKFSDEEILSILENECKFYEKILDEVKPNFLIAERPPYHHNHLFYEICKSKKIKIILLSQSRLAYKSILGKHSYLLDSIDDYENIEGKNRTLEELQNYLKSSSVSKQIKDFKNKFTTSRIKKIKAANDYLLFSGNENLKTHYSYFGRTKYRVLSHAIKSNFKKKYRNYFINKKLLSKIEHNEQFVYFPLAMDEERNLLIGAPFFTNQIETIRHIAKSLPVNHKLYVKEHYNVAIRDWRPISDYEKIIDIPNVKLFHPSVSNDELLRKSSLVITVGGTSGFEAAFYGKPSIILTDTNYSILPSVHKVTSLDDFPSIIRNSLKKKVDPNSLDKFIQILEKDSINFDLYGFMTKMHEHFYYDGNLVNVDFSDSIMHSFLEKNKNELESLADAHKHKIIQYNDELD